MKKVIFISAEITILRLVRKISIKLLKMLEMFCFQGILILCLVKLKEQIYIWVDDIRPLNSLRVPKNIKEIIGVKSYKQAIKVLENAIAANKWIIIDLDHDLGEDKNGYDIAKWIVASGYKSLSFRIHSMNPVGVENM